MQGTVFQSLNADENDKSLQQETFERKLSCFSETVTGATLDRNMLLYII